MSYRNALFAPLLLGFAGCQVSDDATAVSAAPIDRTDSVTLPNRVKVDTTCGGTADHTVVFATTASHEFLGYGANIQGPPSDDAGVSATLQDLRELNFHWVKYDLGNPYKRVDGPAAPVGVGNWAMYDQVGPSLREGFQNDRAFVAALQADGVSLVSTMYGAPKTYTTDFTLPDGSTGTRINPEHIEDFAKFYVAYFRALADVGITPDLSELQNEPNGAWNVKFTPEQFAQLVSGIEAAQDRTGADGHITAAGTATRVQNAVDFVRAIEAVGMLPALNAITLHNYYVIEAPNNDGIPPADDPAFQTLRGLAGAIPMISTEFGGTDLKTKLTDPDINSVNPAEEMKVALDLIRRGDAAALVWNLYPNVADGVALKTWALIDGDVPTKAYWPFKALSPHVPVGADVLAVQSSDVTPTMTSLGYAAWRDGDRIIVAVANPGATDLKVALDIAGTDYVVDAVHSFDESKVVEAATRMGHKRCPITVTVPGDVARNDSGRGAVLELRIKD